MLHVLLSIPLNNRHPAPCILIHLAQQYGHNNASLHVSLDPSDSWRRFIHYVTLLCFIISDSNRLKVLSHHVYLSFS